MMAATLSSLTFKSTSARTPLMVRSTSSMPTSAPAVSCRRLARRASRETRARRFLTFSVISSTERLGTSSSTSGSPVCADWRRRSLASCERRMSSGESGRTGETGEGVGRGCCCAFVVLEPVIEALSSPLLVVVVDCAKTLAPAARTSDAPQMKSLFTDVLLQVW
jgi:hypothetical protein